jgi:hypothetical protein
MNGTRTFRRRTESQGHRRREPSEHGVDFDRGIPGIRYAGRVYHARGRLGRYHLPVLLGILRVSREGELHGLDLYEHGISAYPEYVISGIVSPAATVIGGSSPAPRPIRRIEDGDRAS